MTWSKNGTTTLSSAGDTVTVSSLTATEFNQFIMHGLWTGTTLFPEIRVGNGSVDSSGTNGVSGNYAYRSQADGAPDTTGTLQTSLPQIRSGADLDHFTVGYFINIGTEEKLFIYYTAQIETSSTVAPTRREIVGKWVNTSNQIDTIQSWDNGGTSTFASGTNLTALNGDTTLETILGNNVQSGSRFEATDTRKIYYRATPSLTLDENFSSDNWTDNDSTYIGVSGGALSWNAKRDATNDASSRDLGFVASDKWVLRFKLTQGSSIGATQAGNRIHFGISDSDYSVAQNASQDYIGVAYYYDNQSTYKAQDSDGAIVPEAGGDSTQNITISANDVFYFEIIRNGSSYTVEAFTNSDYSTGSLGKLSGTTTASGLRYLKIMNTLPAQGAIPTSTNPFNGTIDDLKFYNGFTTTTDLEWTEEV